VRTASQTELVFVEHEWTELRHPDGSLLVGVDVGIAPLIEALWAGGYETRSSCENGGEVYGWCPVGMAYVSFAADAECERFAQELRELPRYEPLRGIEFIQLSAYPHTVAFEARLSAAATEQLRAKRHPATDSLAAPSRARRNQAGDRGTATR
jgi:hypothetical protein